MIGNRVSLILTPTEPNVRYETLMGVLHKLDQTGATLYKEGTLPEQHGLVFVPMHRILEIEDRGRPS